MDSNSNLIRDLGRKVKDGTLTWGTATIEFNKATGLNVNKEAFRGRYRNLNDQYVPSVNEQRLNSEYETHNEDGTIELCKEIWFDPKEEKTPENVLKKFGYSINEWELISWTFGKWEVAIKDEKENRVCTTIRAKIKPRNTYMLQPNEYANIAKDVFSDVITPYKPENKIKDKNLNKNKLLEMTGIELHLGKLAFESETGQDYNNRIAQSRFYKILDDVIEQQEIEQCDTCLLCIGNDFFNSDTVSNTTTKGTQQTNDLRWKGMFELGLQMYIQMILTLRDKFNKIEVRLQQGNHDTMAAFYLYIALSCYFKKDKVINFSDDYKELQCFEWGKCAIFFTHGDTNLKRLIRSIPSEFYREWGRTLYRELHLGHLHSEVVVDDNSGMITRRVGSPTGTDAWHYSERFIGATQKYQTFVWDKENGLLNVKYITFDSPEPPMTLKKRF